MHVLSKAYTKIVRDSSISILVNGMKPLNIHDDSNAEAVHPGIGRGASLASAVVPHSLYHTVLSIIPGKSHLYMN